jgi:hypothetical protein
VLGQPDGQGAITLLPGCTTVPARNAALATLAGNWPMPATCAAGATSCSPSRRRSMPRRLP